jgi:peptidyl-prolyl cis-trans isomerase A (cyclophilin A)
MKAFALMCFCLMTAMSQEAAPLAAPGTSGGDAVIAQPAASAVSAIPAAAAATASGEAAASASPAGGDAVITPTPSEAQAAPAATTQSATPKPAATPAKPAREPGLYATIKTSMGDIKVQLFEKQSPLAVKNFVGLAQGTKTWTDPRTGKPTRRPLYNGVTFHRVIPNFMIQGGDPLGNGMGTPGYQFANENSPDLAFDRPGRLAMANAGPNTNGSQFFITVAPYPSLNGGYTIFGQVLEGQDVANKISAVPRNPQDKPLTPVTISRIVIERVGAAPVHHTTTHKTAATTQKSAQ